MKREQRKEEAKRKKPQNITKVSDLFSPEGLAQVSEEMAQYSECRFDAVQSPEAIATIVRATESLPARFGLTVSVPHSYADVPSMPSDARFKYSSQWGQGDLFDCSQRISDGENITIAVASEDDLLIGYGIAVTKDDKSEIEIIDVDDYSRRSAGLGNTVAVGEESFGVGVGHVLARILMQACPKPIKVDASTRNSRYVFKSLGFVHDDQSGNPCILRMD